MTGYAEVDPVIRAWAQVTVKKLFTEWADRPARFAYLPGLRQFECFQIWVQPPTDGRIAVSSASVDSMTVASTFERGRDRSVASL